MKIMLGAVQFELLAACVVLQRVPPAGFLKPEALKEHKQHHNTKPKGALRTATLQGWQLCEFGSSESDSGSEAVGSDWFVEVMEVSL